MVRPSADTNARLPVEANDAVRRPGMARCSRCRTFPRPARTVGELTDVPGGSVTTPISGEVRPPCPNRRWICELVSYPWRPGTLNSLLNALVACPTLAIPAIVTTTQNAATHRLCANTHRVIVVIARPLVRCAHHL